LEPEKMMCNTKGSTMKKIWIVLTAVLLVAGVHAEKLVVTFGAPSDLSAKYGDYNLTGNAKQDNNPAKPKIVIDGLDLDGIGKNDDKIETVFSVQASGGDLKLFGMGYRMDKGYTLTFKIISARMVMGNGKTVPLNGRFVSAAGNNRASTFTAENKGHTLILKSTSSGNNRARNIVAEFDVPVDASKLAAPIIVPVPEKSESKKRSKRKTARKSQTRVASSKPFKVVASPKIETESLLLPRLFCDNMILQQQMKNTFWGWAKPGEKITVKASWGSQASTRADADGRWKLFLETPSFGTGYTLTISGEKDTIKIKNVAIGEVWLCAGQSNMGWAMGNCFGAEEEAHINLPNLRIFKSAREHWHAPLEMQRDRLSHWKPCTPESAAETSAVSYWFAKKLHLELGIPVGIIVQAYAGTPIEGWMPWEIQKDDPRAQAHKAELDATAERQIASGMTVEKALAEFEKALAEYNAKIDAGETMKNSFKPLSPPIITKPANLGHQYPSHIFNAMIYPIRPYGIRGIIWYQGERNAKNVPQAFHYRKQLAMLINYYRSSWNKLSGGNVPADFPFQFTQLPSWTAPQTEPVEGLSAPWAVSREAMRLVTYDVPNTAMAVSIDTGDAVALHPKNKKPVGIRHAYLALKQTYGKNFVDYGPRFKKQTIKGNKIILEFDSIGSGLVPARPGKLDAFAIAGKDRKWHWADAEIEGNTVVVSSPEVPQPVAVRYAWAMNPSQRNLLYNKEGIPASPFRTDDWPLFDPDAEIVTVKKPAKTGKKSEADWERPKMTQ